MAFASESYASRRDTIAFIACLLLSIVVRMAPAPWHDAAASALRRTLLAPFIALQRGTESIRASQAEVHHVMAERDSAMVDATLVDALREENAQLRAVLGLSQRVPVRHVAAEVLHQTLPTDGYTLLLSVGSNQGVKPLAPVIAAGGLVGVVRSVSPSTCIVVAWPHPDFRASAMTADGSVYGIVGPYTESGPTDELLELRGVPYRQHLTPGTRVYTSGLATGEGGIYPRGIPIGTILSVGQELPGWARTYLVLPAVHPASVSHVVVLLDTRADLTNVFTTPGP